MWWQGGRWAAGKRCLITQAAGDVGDDARVFEGHDVRRLEGAVLDPPGVLAGSSGVGRADDGVV